MKTEQDNTGVEELIANNLQLRYEVEDLKKKLSVIKVIAKEIIECSEPSKDPLKETRYICASCFLEPRIKEEEETVKASAI
jgi:regulator of replication initiation timing